MKEVALYTQLNALPDALQRIELAIKLAPDNTRLLLEKTQLLISNQQLDKAANVLQMLAANNQKNPNYWMMQGLLNIKRDNLPQAALDLRKALNFDPTFTRALVSLFNLALANVDGVNYQALSNQIIAIAPDFVLAKLLLARYHFSRREFDLSKQAYLKLLEKDLPNGSTEIYNNLAIMALESNLAEAKQYAAKSIEVNDTHPAALDTFGWILSLEGNYDEGLAFLRKAYARDSENPDIYYHLGYTLAKAGRIDEAKIELNRAVSTQRSFYNRAKAQSLLDSLQ